MIGESLSALSAGLKFWKDRGQQQVNEKRRRDAAIGTVMDAAIATKSYLHDRSEGRLEDREKEHQIARLWQAAANAILEYDHQLFNSARLKALGWSDPSEWRRSTGREWVIKIDNIIEQCDWLQRNG